MDGLTRRSCACARTLMRVRANDEASVPWRSLMEKHEFMYPDGETRDTALRRAIRRVRSVADTYRHNDYETIETWLQHAVRVAEGAAGGERARSVAASGGGGIEENE